jgi:hypothetical protein
VLVIGAMRDVGTLFSSPVAAGLDGYYYVLQVDGLTHGRLFFASYTPLILFLLTGIRFATGNTVVAIKVGAVILNLMLCLGIAGLLIRSTHNWWVGVMGCAYAALAGLHYYMIGEFISNLGALTFIGIALLCLTRATGKRRGLWYGLAFSSVLAAIGSHRSAIFLLGVLAATCTWAYVYHRAILTKNRLLLLATLALIVLFYFVPFFCALLRGRGEFLSEVSIHPRLPITRVTLFETLSLCWAAPFIIIAPFLPPVTLKSRPHILFTAIAVTGVLLSLNAFIHPDLSVLKVAGRLQTLIYLQVALLVPYAVWMVGKVRREYAWYALAASLPLLILGTLIALPRGLAPAYLADREKLISVLPGIKDAVPNQSLIMAPHGDEFVITSLTGIRSQNSWPKNPPGVPVYWLLHRVPRAFDVPPFRELITDTHGTVSILVKDEDLWPAWTLADPRTRLRVSAANPHLSNFLGVAMSEESPDVDHSNE